MLLSRAIYVLHHQWHYPYLPLLGAAWAALNRGF